MQTRTGTYLHEQRTSRRLTREQLAERIGYKNLAKGARRIQVLEEEAMAVDGLLGRIVRVLELDPNHVLSLVEQDRRALEGTSIEGRTRRLWETALKKWIWHLEPEEIRPDASCCRPSRVLPPAATCAICDRPLRETGGKRLVACSTASIWRTAIQRPLPPDRSAYPARLVRLTWRYRDALVWAGGPAWTDEGVQRAAAAFQRREHPWVCQRCARIHLCARCGTPIDRTPMSDCLYDDGRILHTAHFAGYGKPFCPTCGMKTAWIKPLGTPEIAGVLDSHANPAS